MGRVHAMVVRVGDRCPWGALCRFGAAGKCRGEHTLPEDAHFARKREIRKMEAKAPCAFCVRGCCRFGAGCRRGMREDSDYGGSDEGDGEQWAVGSVQRRQHTAEVRCEECDTAGNAKQATAKGAAMPQAAAKEAAAKVGTAKQAAMRQAAVQQSAAKEAAAQQAATKEAAAQEATVQQTAARQAVAKEAAVQQAAVKEAAAKPTTKEATTKEAATQPTANKYAAANEATAKKAAAKQAAAKEAAMQEAAAKAAAAKQVAAKEAEAKQAAVTQATTTQAATRQATTQRAATQQAVANEATVQQAMTWQAAAMQAAVQADKAGRAQVKEAAVQETKRQETAQVQATRTGGNRPGQLVRGDAHAQLTVQGCWRQWRKSAQVARYDEDYGEWVANNRWFDLRDAMSVWMGWYDRACDAEMNLMLLILNLAHDEMRLMVWMWKFNMDEAVQEATLSGWWEAAAARPIWRQQWQ